MSAIEVRDTAGRVLARHRVGGPVAAVARAPAPPGPTHWSTSLAGQLEAVAAALADGRRRPTSARPPTALAAMGVLDAARSAPAAGGRPTPVPLSEEP